MYLEAGNSTQYNPQAVLKILQYMAKSGIVFGGINFQVNQCRNCKEHFSSDNNDEPICPKCGSNDVAVTRIITGYLSTLSKFNAGKIAESNDREAHL